MNHAPEKLVDLHVKELDMLQAIIARLATYGAALKNYCITLTTAVAGLALTLQRPAAIFLAVLPAVICGLLDAQYLRTERRFRHLFRRLTQQDWNTRPTFDFGLSAAPPEPYVAALFSWSVTGFYLPLILAVISTAIIVGNIYGYFL